MKVLISKKTGIYYYYNGNGDFHSKEGFVTVEDINSGKSRVISNTKREFIVFDANNYDKSKKIKRGPQILLPKDLGYIISRSGINKKSFIVEAGGGSGAATIFFAGIVKKVHTYEIKEDHCNIIKKNLEFMGVDNVELFNMDLLENIEKEKEVDMLFLDMADSTLILEKDMSGIKMGSYIVCYTPSISQVQDISGFVGKREDLYLEEISEVILRHWRVCEKVSRPEHRKEIDHTAFLVFIRKI